MNKLLLLHKACPLSHSVLDIKTKKIKITLNIRCGKDYCYSYCNLDDYFSIGDLETNNYRVTLSYFSFEICEKLSTSMNLPIICFGTDDNYYYFDKNVNTNLACPNYICVCKSVGAKSLDKLICKKTNRLYFGFSNLAPKNGIIVLNATLHYFTLKN